jgi:ankyrin repeat protein
MGRTHEIKSNILTNKNLLESLIIYIKEDNYHRVIETIHKNKMMNLEARSNQGQTILNVAVECSNFKIVKYLLEIGSDVNSQDVIFYYLGAFEYTITLCALSKEL